MHLELGLEMIKQDALAQHLCCIFTRKCFLRLDTQVLASLCAQRPHPPCMCGACARLSQHAQRVRRYWPFHILLWRVSPWARVSVISCQISYLFKSPLLHFGKERKWIERWFCPSEQWKHWSHGIYYQLPEHWQPGVEVVSGSIWALGGCVGSHVWGLLLPMSPWAMSEAQALSSVDQWPFPSVMTLVSRHVASWRALIWGECPASFPVWEPAGTWCDSVVWPGSCPSLKLDTYTSGHHVVCHGAESRW